MTKHLFDDGAALRHVEFLVGYVLHGILDGGVRDLIQIFGIQTCHEFSQLTDLGSSVVTGLSVEI